MLEFETRYDSPGGGNFLSVDSWIHALSRGHSNQPVMQILTCPTQVSLGAGILTYESEIFYLEFLSGPCYMALCSNSSERSSDHAVLSSGLNQAGLSGCGSGGAPAANVYGRYRPVWTGWALHSHPGDT